MYSFSSFKVQRSQNNNETEKHHQKTHQRSERISSWQQQMMDNVFTKPVIIKTTVVLDVNSHQLAWHRGDSNPGLTTF